MFDNTVGLGIDAADKHRNTAIDDLHNGLNDVFASPIGGESDLTR